jgi:type II secretory pathway component PulJ
MSRINRQSAHAGFTLVEVLIIAPVVILAITGFVALMVAMTSDVLITRDNNTMTFETQDTLDRIEQDVHLSTQFLVTSGTFTAPQGSDSNFTGTAAFSNTNSLILGGLTTDKNPADSTRDVVYYAGQPNVCGSQQSYNRVFLQKIMYFVKDGSLWRRAVLPNYNTNATLDDDTVCSVPWQRNTCSPGYSPATRCQTNDTEVMKNVSSFSIKYFSDPKSTTEIGSANALAATTIEATINGSKTTAGRTITSAGSMRATKLNSIDVDIPAPGIPTVTGQVVNTSVTFSWPKVPLASSYAISYNINGGSWTNAINNSQTTTYNVAAELGDTITMHVYARNSTGSSAYGEAITTIPTYTACNLENGWVNYVNTYATAGYTKTSSNVVMLKGLIRDGNAAVGTVLCTLPVGYRPTERLGFLVATQGGEATAGRIDVLPTGEVVVDSVNSSWVGFDNIRFVASTAPYTWSNLPLSNGWVNYGFGFATLRSTVDSIGRVHVQGLIKNGVYADWTIIATVPAGQYASHFMILPSFSDPAGFNSFGITSSGPLTARGSNGSGWYFINGHYYPSSFNGWTDLSMQNGWVNFDTSGYVPAQYTKSTDKVVTVRGLIKNGNTAAGTVIANLPVGYRPKERLLFGGVGVGIISRLDVLPNGNIEIRSANAGWTSLDAISFIAEQ